MRKKILANHGVVFLETVFVAPLYLVILLGMFWVADNTTARAKLAELDRTYTWAMGNRHDAASTLSSLYDDIYSMELPSDPDNPYELTFALNAATTKPAGDTATTAVTTAWWRWTDAQVQLSRELPSFLRGLRIIHDLFIESQADPVDKKGKFLDLDIANYTWSVETEAGYDPDWMQTQTPPPSPLAPTWHTDPTGYSLAMNAQGEPTSDIVTARVLSRNGAPGINRLAGTYWDENWLTSFHSETMPTGDVMAFINPLQDVETWTRKTSFVTYYSE
jgi:hypothetical protein